MTGSKGTILIIDDDLGLQAVLKVALQDAGYTVLIAHDGEEGLARIGQVSFPGLILCDIMMPNMDGVEMFERIKEHLQDDGIPIIIMTALNRKSWFADIESEGAAIVQKPFEIDDLIRLIDLALL